MKLNTFAVCFLLVLILLDGCHPKSSDSEINLQARGTNLLASWDSLYKDTIVQYVNVAVKQIPIEDRIAVFDMDGTILCEKPIWLEMYAAVKGLVEQSTKNPSLINSKEYEYAKKLWINPFDKTVTDHFTSNIIHQMVWNAYAGYDNEEYIDSARSYFERTPSPDPRFQMKLGHMFYQPMLELIQFLEANNFSIYIVSGSVQGLMWSVCPQVIGFERSHMIGTTQELRPVYDTLNHKTEFIIGDTIFVPENNGNGKTLNIYSHIGKNPVFAFGNTSGDFGMFHIAATSKYPHAEFLLNHDDSVREYAYPPYYDPAYKNWQDSMSVNGWKIVNMSEAFKAVFRNSIAN